MLQLLALLAEYGWVCSGGGTLTPYSVYQFNLDPAGDNSGLRSWSGANSIQLAEITLYDAAGVRLDAGLVCTNPGGSNPGGELPEHACNGLTASDPNGCSGCANSGHKWLDFNKGDLVMTFASPVTAATWDWQTANDAPNRDADDRNRRHAPRARAVRPEAYGDAAHAEAGRPFDAVCESPQRSA